MITIAVASTNPVKARATLNGFQRVFPGVDFKVDTIAAPSAVSHQPMSDKETLLGALNRMSNAMHARPQADYWIGMEGGIQVMDGELAVMAWIVVRSPTRIGKSRTGTFFLPPAVAELVRQGKELGEADDLIFNRLNSKQDNGTVGILTDNVIDRVQLYEHALILALIPFKNEKLYTDDTSLTGGERP